MEWLGSACPQPLQQMVFAAGAPLVSTPPETPFVHDELTSCDMPSTWPTLTLLLRPIVDGDESFPQRRPSQTYSAASQAGSTFHRMMDLQVFRAKQLLHTMDEFSPDSAAFKELHSATALALCASKTMAQAISLFSGAKAPTMVKLGDQVT